MKQGLINPELTSLVDEDENKPQEPQDLVFTGRLEASRLGDPLEHQKVDHLKHKRLRPLGFNLGTRSWDMGRVWGTNRDTGLGHGVRFRAIQGRWLGLGHGVRLTDRWVAGTGNGVGLGDKHGGSEPESDLQGLTWGHGTGKRVRLTVSGRKADRLECVPACIYQCHYVRASVLQHVGTYECVHLCVYASVSICSYSAMSLLCVCACHFSAFQAIHFPAVKAIHFPAVKAIHFPALQANPRPSK